MNKKGFLFLFLSSLTFKWSIHSNKNKSENRFKLTPRDALELQFKTQKTRIIERMHDVTIF